MGSQGLSQTCPLRLLEAKQRKLKRLFATAARVSLPAGRVRASARRAGPTASGGRASAEPRTGPTWTLPSPRHRAAGAQPEEHDEDTRHPLLAHTHPWSACPALRTSPSTSGTARASSRRPEETRRRVRGREPGAGAGRRLWRLANPASASLPQTPTPKTCARPRAHPEPTRGWPPPARPQPRRRAPLTL